MNIAVSAKNVLSLDKVVDAACEDLGVKMQTLDIGTRDRLVQRILALLSAEKSRSA